MKRKYDKPTIRVVPLQPSHIICTSVINPGTDNTTPGAHSFDTIDWDENWDN